MLLYSRWTEEVWGMTMTVSFVLAVFCPFFFLPRPLFLVLFVWTQRPHWRNALLLSLSSKVQWPASNK